MSPQFAPSIGGFIVLFGWRWTFGIAAILGGVSFIPILCLPETYEPILLQKQAQRMRETSGSTAFYAPIELEKKKLKDVVTIFLARPLRMMAGELIVLLTCLYLSFSTGIYCLLTQFDFFFFFLIANLANSLQIYSSKLTRLSLKGFMG
jgi:Major Facilitator Superfamily